MIFDIIIISGKQHDFFSAEVFHPSIIASNRIRRLRGILLNWF